MKEKRTGDLKSAVRESCFKKAAVGAGGILALGAAFILAAGSIHGKGAEPLEGREAGHGVYRALAGSPDFAEYERYGLRYDPDENRLMYDGEVVGYFHDETAAGVYTHIVERDGTAAIRVRRDSDYQITGFELAETPESGGGVVSEKPES